VASALAATTASPGHQTVKVFAIAAGVVGVAVLVSVAACVAACCYRRPGYCLPFVIDSRRFATRKRRVVVMHSNSLYNADAASKRQYPHQLLHHQNQQQQQLTLLMPPRVKIETSGLVVGNRRQLLSTVFEYDIPLDRQREFPRDKSVQLDVCDIAARLRKYYFFILRVPSTQHLQPRDSIVID